MTSSTIGSRHFSMRSKRTCFVAHMYSTLLLAFRKILLWSQNCSLFKQLIAWAWRLHTFLAWLTTFFMYHSEVVELMNGSMHFLIQYGTPRAPKMVSTSSTEIVFHFELFTSKKFSYSVLREGPHLCLRELAWWYHSQHGITRRRERRPAKCRASGNENMKHYNTRKKK